MKKVIIADDNLLIAEAIKSYTEMLKYKVIVICRNKKEILLEIEKNKPDIILLDISMESDSDGITACKEIKINFNDIYIIFLTGYPIITLKKELKHVNYDGYIEKPVTFDKLKNSLDNLFV